MLNVGVHRNARMGVQMHGKGTIVTCCPQDPPSERRQYYLSILFILIFCLARRPAYHNSGLSYAQPEQYAAEAARPHLPTSMGLA